MSSTGIKTDTYNDLEADIIDVNDSLFINKINVINYINDLSENLYDVSGNLNSKINDVSGNLNALNNTVTDLSENVQAIESKNSMQDVTLTGHGAQITANTDALVALTGVVTTNAAVTTANSATIAGIIGTLGVPSTAITPGTGIYGSIDSKTSRSLFSSGNVAIYGTGPTEYINLVYNNEHFEDITGINTRVFNLKEPYKSLPSSLNNLQTTKQDNLLFTSPLLKDISNNVTIDLSAYALKNSLNASNITTGTLSTARGGTQWGFNGVNINYTAGNVMTNSLLCGYGGANLIPNSSYKNYIMLRHNTFNGNIGSNFPNPECALLMSNSSGSNTLPWCFYSGVVKYVASTNANSLRYDIGTCTINNTVVTATGENTFTPYMSMSYSGNIGIGTTNPSYKLGHIPVGSPAATRHCDLRI